MRLSVLRADLLAPPEACCRHPDSHQESNRLHDNDDLLATQNSMLDLTLKLQVMFCDLEV